MKALDILTEADVVTPTALENPTNKKVPAAPQAGAKLTDTGPASAAFRNKLKQIAARLGVSTSDLLRIMHFESGLDPARTNEIGAVGLIQFLPKTARNLGTTTAELAKMSAVDQLDYVEKYYKMNQVKPGMDLGDLYLMTYMPAAVQMNKPDDFVLGINPVSTAWNKADKYGRPFPNDPAVTRANNWDKNPAFANYAKKNNKDYFDVGDIRKYITAR
jgi:hypothetical protein